ncbi:hypothetical protein AHAS_Ahas20G0197800 [Arachis hypogaea]
MAGKGISMPHSVHQETSSFDCVVNTFMQDCSPGRQNDLYIDEYNNYSCCGWEDQNQTALNSPYSTYQEPSSLESTFNSFMQNCPTSLPSFSFENSSPLEYASAQNSFNTSQNDFTTMPMYPETHSQPSSLELAFEQYLQTSIESWKEQETLYKKIDGHLEKARKNEE